MKEFNWKSDKSIVYSLTVEGDGEKGGGAGGRGKKGEMSGNNVKINKPFFLIERKILPWIENQDR